MKNGIVFACNSTFYEGLVVGINSFRHYNPQTNIEVLNTGLSVEQVKKLQSKWGGKSR